MTSDPRDAATVLLIRDASSRLDTGVEVWMLRRKDTLVFAPNAWVFPGGVVETHDALPLQWLGRELEAVAEGMRCDTKRAATLVAAAIRETFEECGVLLAGFDRQGVDESDRQELLEGRVSLQSMLQRHGGWVDGDALVPWAWWLTPDWSPRRYDTWFFLARLPAGQEPRHVEAGEASVARWVSPAAMVREHNDGAALLLPPTLECLERLAAFSSVDDVFAATPPTLEQRSG